MASKNRFTSRMIGLLTNEVAADSLCRKAYLHIYQVGRIIFSALRTVWHHVQSKWYFRRKIKKLTGRSDDFRYVIKTFVYDHSFDQSGDYHDVFFGRLPQILTEHGQSVLVYAVILGDRKKCLRAMTKCPNVEIIPVELFCSGWKILADMVRLLFFRFRPLETVLFNGRNVAALINQELLLTLNDIPPYQYLHYRFVEALTKKIRIGTFLQTGENNPWERMCIMALRRFSPATRVLSYQHAVVPLASANMFAGSDEVEFAPVPDHLLTTGSEPKIIIEQYGCYPDGFVQAACGLRYEYFAKTRPLHFSKDRKKTVLLALEGIPSVTELVEYAVRSIGGHADYRIIIRAHPALPFEKLATRLPSDLELPSNVEISRGKALAEDLERSDIVMYWGSTVALEALYVGRPVVHFDMEKQLNYDPLFNCGTLGRTVNKNTCLEEVLADIFGQTEDVFFGYQAVARDYLKEYFAPVCSSNIEPFFTREK